MRLPGARAHATLLARLRQRGGCRLSLQGSPSYVACDAAATPRELDSAMPAMNVDRTRARSAMHSHPARPRAVTRVTGFVGLPPSHAVPRDQSKPQRTPPTPSEGRRRIAAAPALRHLQRGTPLKRQRARGLPRSRQRKGAATTIKRPWTSPTAAPRACPSTQLGKWPRP